VPSPSPSSTSASSGSTTTQLFARLRNVDLGLIWINLLILATTALLPFPTGILAGAASEGASGSREAAVVLYAIVGALLSAAWIPVFPYLTRHPDLLLDPNDAGVLAKQKSRPLVRVGSYLLASVLGYCVSPLLALIASAQEAKDAKAPPSLSERQIRVYLGPPGAQKLTPIEPSAQLERQTAAVQQLAAHLDRATLIALRKAVQPGAPLLVEGNIRSRPTIELARRFDSPGGGTSYRVDSELYVATPAVLRYLGIDPATLDTSTDFLVDRSADPKELAIPSMTDRREFAVANVQTIDVAQHRFGGNSGAEPASFITVNGLRRHGWKQIPAGWLVESRRPLTSGQIADARNGAAAAGLTIEVQRKNNPPTRVMAIATAAGALLALAILAMTVGLIRSESAGDLRTLTAAGATSGIRRTLTAITAGALALLGALLGIARAYVALAALYHDDLGYLSDVPVLYLALVVVGVPLCAVAPGWLLAGREPPAIARPVID